MNSHVPKEIIDKYPNFVFKGKTFTIKDRLVIRADNPSTGIGYFYSFEEDFFWFRTAEMPDWKLPKINN